MIAIKILISAFVWQTTTAATTGITAAEFKAACTSQSKHLYLSSGKCFIASVRDQDNFSIIVTIQAVGNHAQAVASCADSGPAALGRGRLAILNNYLLDKLKSDVNL